MRGLPAAEMTVRHNSHAEWEAGELSEIYRPRVWPIARACSAPFLRALG
jgi:hypothetical protein